MSDTEQKLPPVPGRFRIGFLDGMDKRLNLYRALRAAHAEILEDLGNNTSHIQSALVERFVWAEGIAQSLENNMAEGDLLDEAELSKWVKAVQVLSSLAKTLGIERKSTSQPWITAAVVKEAKRK